VTYRARYVSGPQVSENTAFIRGVRQRFEFPGVTMITQCDLKRNVQLHDGTRRFLVMSSEATAGEAVPVDAVPLESVPAAASGPAKSKPQGGVITETITMTDTGERKQVYGLEARHITTLIVRQPGPKACDARTTRVETDGWYVDLPERDACPVAAQPAVPAQPTQACTDRVERQQTGDAKLGFALSTTVTTTIEDGKDKDVATTTMDVADLRITSLDAALFAFPPGFRDYS
jgi:hypothetical protein